MKRGGSLGVGVGGGKLGGGVRGAGGGGLVDRWWGRFVRCSLDN